MLLMMMMITYVSASVSSRRCCSRLPAGRVNVGISSTITSRFEEPTTHFARCLFPNLSSLRGIDNASFVAPSTARQHRTACAAALFDYSSIGKQVHTQYSHVRSENELAAGPESTPFYIRLEVWCTDCEQAE